MLIYVVCFCALNSVVFSRDLPSTFPRCHIDDVNLNDCLRDTANAVREYVIKGIPELDIPELEPLVIPEITLSQETNAVKYRIKLSNVIINGLGRYKFIKYTYNPKTQTFHGALTFESMTIAADYELDGKILSEPINGRGKVTAILGPSKGYVDTKGKLERRKNEIYFIPKEVKGKSVLTTSSVKFDGLFEKNSELEKTINRIINDNYDELLKEVTPTIEKVVEELVFKMEYGIFSRVPFNKLYPPSH